MQLGLSQEDLARRAGVDVKTIGNVEAGCTIPRPSTQRLLAEALQAAGDGRGGFYAAEPFEPVEAPPAGPRRGAADQHGPGTRWPTHPPALPGADRPVSWELLYEIAEAFQRNGFPPPSGADLMHLGVVLGRILNRPAGRGPCAACPGGQCALGSGGAMVPMARRGGSPMAR
jgi:transcriptional regulator with XRE-family HTH domain